MFPPLYATLARVAPVAINISFPRMFTILADVPAVKPVRATERLYEVVDDETSAFTVNVFEPFTARLRPFIVSVPFVLNEYPSVIRVLPSKR